MSASQSAVATRGSAARVPQVPEASGGWSTRRGVLAWSGWATMGLIGLQAATAFLVYFWPRKRGAFGKPITAGRPDDYKVGDVKYFVDGQFYLTRLEEGFLALWQKCPHLGCTVPWRPEFKHMGYKSLFRCPCHGSTYLQNGQLIDGPAPRSMDIMPITLENGRLVVNTARQIKRDKWDPSQAFRV